MSFMKLSLYFNNLLQFLLLMKMLQKILKYMNEIIAYLVQLWFALLVFNRTYFVICKYCNYQTYKHLAYIALKGVT